MISPIYQSRLFGNMLTLEKLEGKLVLDLFCLRAIPRKRVKRRLALFWFFIGKLSTLQIGILSPLE